MPNKQQTDITEILDNIAMSCRMEGLEMTDEIRAMCLAIYNGSATLQDCLHKINAKYLWNIIYANRVAVRFYILQKPENNLIDIISRCFRWVYPIDMLKKYRLLMSRYFCVQSSSMMSANRPIIVSAPRMTFPAFIFSPPQLSEKFSTASIIKSTTAPTAWKIGPNGIISNASFQSVRI